MMRLLVTIAALILAAIAAIGIRWALENFVGSRDAATSTGDPRLSFTHSAHLAEDALAHFEALPGAERKGLRAELSRSLWTLERWLAHVNHAPPAMLCLGERHDRDVRAFLARHLLPRLDMDVLMLEAANTWVRRAVEAHRAREPVPELLGAPIDGVIAAALERARPMQVVGVDESALERRARRALARADLSRRAREDSIVGNLRRRWRPGARHVILFGALHCRDLPEWFYARLPRESDVVTAEAARNAVVLARYQEPAIQGLMYLLDELGLEREVLVVADTRSFPEQLLIWLPNVADAFATFDTAILFDDRRLDTR